MTKLIILLLLSFVAVSPASAGMVWENGFDPGPDWHSAEVLNQSGTGYNAAWPSTWKDNPSGCGAKCPPSGFTSYRSVRQPGSPQPVYMFVLDSASARGGSGKGMAYNPEMLGYGGWAGGGLDIYLGESGYQELYYRMWVRYPLALWHFSPVTSNISQVHNISGKVNRISRWNGGALSTSVSPQSFINAHTQGPVFYPDATYNAYTAYVPHSYLEPSYTVWDWNTWIDPLKWTPNQVYGVEVMAQDDLWHSLEFRVKMNSAGGVADGEVEMWVDGLSDASHHWLKTGVAWVSAGFSTANGWNWLEACDNIWLDNPSYNGGYSTMYLDDLAIYTKMTGTETECNGQCTADGRLPQSYIPSRVGWTDGAPATTPGSCGTAAGQTFSSIPTANLCAQGTASAVALNGSAYSWTCTADTVVNCTATYSATPVTAGAAVKAAMRCNFR